MDKWLIAAGVSTRIIANLVKLPFPEHYAIISLAPQYNATKSLEVIHQQSIGAVGHPSTSVCQVLIAPVTNCSLTYSCGY